MDVGLQVKYNVTKIEDGTLVHGCFVLRPDKDKAAIEALRAYARVTDNRELAADIIKWVGENNRLTVMDLNKRAEESPVYVVPMGEAIGKWEPYWGIISLHNKAILDVWETALPFDCIGVTAAIYDYPPA